MAAPVILPRVQAIRIAELERDSLVLRQNEGGKCAPLWAEAARSAGLVVWALRRGWDNQALAYARDVGRQWGRAANCVGWKTPAAQRHYRAFRAGGPAATAGACCSECATGLPCATGAEDAPKKLPMTVLFLLGIAGFVSWRMLAKG
jgi:hypothetical protein